MDSSNAGVLIKNAQHQHNFNRENHQGERNTLYVLILTVVTMFAEIIAGTIYGSMALLADGWHMGTHAAAFLITLFAYYYVRKHKNSEKYAFGPSKVSVLAGFSSAIALLLVALVMIVESILRLFSPQEIYFEEAIFVALIGLAVNVVSVFLLKDHHSHADSHHSHAESHHSHADLHHSHADSHHSHADLHHSHADSHHSHADLHHSHADSHHSHDESHHSHDESHHSHAESHHSHAESHHSHDESHHSHDDHNLRAAYFHVLADALTSILAIVALLFGKYLGLSFLDPLMGIVGALIISRWAWGLMKQTGPILLDKSIDPRYKQQIINCIQSEKYQLVSDIHIWKISADHFAAIISVVSTQPFTTDHYKKILLPFDQLTHLTIEINTHNQIE